LDLQTGSRYELLDLQIPPLVILLPVSAVRDLVKVWMIRISAVDGAVPHRDFRVLLGLALQQTKRVLSVFSGAGDCRVICSLVEALFEIWRKEREEVAAWRTGDP
jgi:hypothetical protein